MSGLTLYCAGVVDTSALTCDSGWQAVVANPPFDLTQLDPAVCVEAFVTGFFVLVPVWAVLIGGALILKIIRSR